MADLAPAPTPKSGCDDKHAEGKPGNADKRKKSRFPTSKRVDFAGALGLVAWVWSEMMGTHEASKLCVQFLILVIFYIPVCYYISKWRNDARTGYSLFYFFAFVTAIFAWRNAFSPAFSIITRQQYIAMKRPRYFMSVNIAGRLSLSPINVLMLIQFTNLRDKSMMVNSYQFEGRTTNGEWQVMPTIDIKDGRMIGFVGTNYESGGIGLILGLVKEGDAVALDAGSAIFPEVFSKFSIPSGGTVSGYVFLEGPTKGFDGTMRCRILDATDKEFMELISAPQTNMLQTWLPMVETGIGIPEKEDVKKFPIIPWSQLMH